MAEEEGVLWGEEEGVGRQGSVIYSVYFEGEHIRGRWVAGKKRASEGLLERERAFIEFLFLFSFYMFWVVVCLSVIGVNGI